MGEIVQRSGLCADHAVTLGILHLLICGSLFGRGGVPRSLGEALSLIVSVSASAILPSLLVGRQVCVRAELLPIALGNQGALMGLKKDGREEDALLSTQSVSL